MDVKPLLKSILAQYQLPLYGTHGVTHWARVLDNGRRLAALNGANLEIITLFALFHDACRVNEAWDHGHGRRGASLAAALRGKLFDLAGDGISLLTEACAHHTDGSVSDDVTVGTCWDADRLDLERVGTRTHPRFLSTPAARDPLLLEWASLRARQRLTPALVAAEWGLNQFKQ